MFKLWCLFVVSKAQCAFVHIPQWQTHTHTHIVRVTRGHFKHLLCTSMLIINKAFRVLGRWWFCLQIGVVDSFVHRIAQFCARTKCHRKMVRAHRWMPIVQVAHRHSEGHMQSPISLICVGMHLCCVFLPSFLLHAIAQFFFHFPLGIAAVLHIIMMRRCWCSLLKE